MKYILNFIKAVFGIPLGLAYGVFMSIIVVTPLLFSSLLIHLASIIPVLSSVFKIYKDKGYNSFMGLLACILHLPFLLIYASISLIIPATIRLILQTVYLILTCAYRGTKPEFLIASIPEDLLNFNRWLSLIFYHRLYNIFQELNILLQQIARNIPARKVPAIWGFTNFIYLGEIYCVFLFMEGMFLRAAKLRSQYNPEENYDFPNTTIQSRNNIQANQILKALKKHGDPLLNDAKHTILSPSQISTYKSYKNSKIDALLEDYDSLKSKLLTDTCPISQERPNKKDIILLSIWPNQIPTVYSRESFKQYIEHLLSQSHRYQANPDVTTSISIKNPVTNDEIGCIYSNQTFKMLDAVYMHPLYSDSNNESIIYCARLNEIENEIIRIIANILKSPTPKHKPADKNKHIVFFQDTTAASKDVDSRPPNYKLG